jgi:histidine ammonia-lyase
MTELGGQPLKLGELAAIAAGEAVCIAASARGRMEASLRVVQQAAAAHEPVYGINTGFGKLCDVKIPDADIERLQLNLVRSHACGAGPLLSEGETRVMVALRANTLALGHSGVRPEVADWLCQMINRGVCPAIPSKGSVGASGDLAPLAHLALCAIGEGEAMYRGRPMASSEALQQAGLVPLRLQAKEGLALLNGTQAMTAVGALALRRAWRLADVADVAGALTLSALRGARVAFDQRIHTARPHAGQAAVAARLRQLLGESDATPVHVQDAYSLRCMPQVHGAARDALAFARHTVEIESGSATDNPLVFADPGDVLSGGNFHGAPLALAFDTAAIAMTTLGSIAERRIDRLVNPDLNQGLPAFLAAHPGVGSGFMIAHVAAVSLLSECKVLAHPASVDNLPTSGGQEDHVSMGMTAALKLRQVVENGEMIAAIELLAASQALHFREPIGLRGELGEALAGVRAIAPPIEEDRPLSRSMAAMAAAIRKGRFCGTGLPASDGVTS